MLVKGATGACLEPPGDNPLPKPEKELKHQAAISDRQHRTIA